MRAGILTVLLVSCLVPVFSAETVRIEADRDATLIEDPDGALANGSGPFLFVGRIDADQGSTRRALVRFDVAGALPRNAIVESVSLSLLLSRSNEGIRTVRVHRVLADWGEGASSTSGGGGAPAQGGDATWIHTFWDSEFWTHGGGQFVGRPSASLDVAGPAPYAWAGTNHLIADVRLWKSAPKRNFGWILIGDERMRQTAMAFASRENPDLALRPVLEVTYRLPPGQAKAPSFATP